jgi:ribosomal protein S4
LPNTPNPRKNKKHKKNKRPRREKKQTAYGVRLKEKQKMQKTTEEEENIFLSGFPIKNFGNDEKGGVTPECFYRL